MKLAARACVIASILAVCACSQDNVTNQALQAPAASAAPVIPAVHRANPATEPALPAVPTLSYLMKQADFAAAYQSMEGERDLPGWIRAGGEGGSSHRVTVGSKLLLGVFDCKPDQCMLERMALLYDQDTHEMWGVFARAKNFMMDGPDKTTDQLKWLGRPDERTRRALEEVLY